MRISSRGLGLFAGAAALLIVGFGFGYAELALLGAAAAIALACAVTHAAWQPRLAVSRSAEPDRVSRGQPSTMTVTVANTGRLRSADLIAADRCGNRSIAVPLLRLRPGRDTTVDYPVPTHRRGMISIGPLRITRRDALGLVSATRSYGDPLQVWVHPKIYPLAAIPAGVVRSMDGRLDRVPHGSITFDSLREYVVGDELRRVHWRTTARVGELMIREYVDTSLPRIVVLLDNRAEAHPKAVDGIVETFESACEAAASVVAAAARDGLPVSLLLVADDNEPSSHQTDHGYLDRLAAVNLHRTADHSPPLPIVANRLRQQRLGDTLIFLTGPKSVDELGLIGAVRGAYPSIVVGIFGADGTTPPGAPGMIILDVADGAGFAAEWDGIHQW